MATLQKKEDSRYWFACWRKSDGTSIKRSTKLEDQQQAQVKANQMEALDKAGGPPRQIITEVQGVKLEAPVAVVAIPTPVAFEPLEPSLTSTCENLANRGIRQETVEKINWRDDPRTDKDGKLYLPWTSWAVERVKPWLAPLRTTRLINPDQVIDRLGARLREEKGSASGRFAGWLLEWYGNERARLFEYPYLTLAQWEMRLVKDLLKGPRYRSGDQTEPQIELKPRIPPPKEDLYQAF